MRKRNLAIAVLLALFAFAFFRLGKVQAQSSALQIQAAATHTSCTVATGITQFCFASDGLWQSISGGAYTQLGTPGGVTSISVNGGTAQTGAVALTIPSKATTTVTSTASTTLQ